MTSSQDSYVSDTSPIPYHQIIVLSQKVINAGFKNMWKIAQGDDNSPLKHFKKSIHGEYIDSDVGVPSVQLHVKSREPMLYFLLSLTKGELAVYESDESENLLTWDINDWVLAFNVVIDQKQISKDSDKYKEFKERAGLPESNFSLAQLFIDSSSSTKLNRDLTTFGEHSLDELSPAASASVLQFLTHWITVMSESDNSVLGYAAQREKDSNELNEYAPSFPPTSIDYFPYPWLGDSGDGSAQDFQDQNSLSYLMMSDFQDPPIQGAMPYTGAWTDGGSRGATYCMGKSLFWGWLLPLMRTLSMAMAPVPETPYVEYIGTPPETPFSFGARFHIGDDNASDDDYNWIPSNQSTWEATSPTKYTDARADDPNKKNDYQTAQQWSRNIEAKVYFEAGKETITLGGSSRFTFDLTHTRGSYPSTRFLMHADITWSIPLQMASIEEGGVIFQMPQKGNVNVSPVVEIDTMRLDDLPTAIAQRMADSLKERMSSALSSVENELTYALANANRLCLPAAGTFFMKDPIFNQKGDLLVQLAYDGADPPPPPKKGKYKL
ncbi:hypothetical protein F4810DRAFT_656079 [Camillea tinctor]|nr:hypothetical protein F4810DRAFT_656079 [Camillea tinctor]